MTPHKTRLSSLMLGSSATRKLARNRLLISRQTIDANSLSCGLRAAFAYDRRRMEWLGTDLKNEGLARD